jgi:predicted dehydrogenase/threonine dehydrogenase-like Zn-dependent dehydrogenase
MKQILQNVRDGKTRVAEVPEPLARPGQVLIANSASLLSAGTEKMVLELTKKSLLGKAKERPDQVRRVLEKMRNEGLFNTFQQVQAKLDEPMTMGYCSSGLVLACGKGVESFKPGDRVASNGPHAGVVSVSKNLCAPVPENVSFEQASFTVLGAIALQGVRLSKLQLGETALVVGLGLVGQLAVQILRAAGIRVIGTDPDEGRCRMAMAFGAETARQGISHRDVEELTGGLGADAVLLTASTKSNGPMELASQAVRKKGRIVLVGVVGLELDRRPFYFKESEFVVSCSYGPGRYDPSYEDAGKDYPAPYVRWTEQRNLSAVLQLMAQGRLDVSRLITHRFAIEEGEKAYKLIETASEPYLGIILQYPEITGGSEKRLVRSKPTRLEGRIGYGCLGSGQFARAVLLPAIQKQKNFHPVLLCSAGGVSASHAGEKMGFDAVTTDEGEVLKSPDVQAVFILTRHDQHGAQVLESLKAGKHTFVEKPLTLTLEEIGKIEELLLQKGDQAPLLTVGFNRRFSPSARRLRAFFSKVAAPKTISIRFNAGILPPEHWTQDSEVGGGRLIGEACHAIDLATYLAGSRPVRVYAESVGGEHAPSVSDDQAFITLRHADGSISSIAYLAGGDKAFPKERVEVIGGGRVAVIEDFRQVELWSGGKPKVEKETQDKGHTAEMEAWAKALKEGGPAPIPWEELKSVSMASILAVQSLREGVPFDF